MCGGVPVWGIVRDRELHHMCCVLKCCCVLWDSSESLCGVKSPCQPLTCIMGRFYITPNPPNTQSHKNKGKEGGQIIIINIKGGRGWLVEHQKKDDLQPMEISFYYIEHYLCSFSESGLHRITSRSE